MKNTKNTLFPFEMIAHNKELLFAKHHHVGQYIYITVLVTLALMIAALPLIKVSVTTQSHGVIKAERDNNPITSGVNGQISEIRLRENLPVKKGDTLLVLNTAKIDQEYSLNEQKIQENALYMRDLSILLRENESLPNGRLSTSLFNQEYLQYTQKLAEYELKAAYENKNLKLTEKLLQIGSVAKVEHDRRVFEYELAERMLETFVKQQKKTWELEMQKYVAQNRELSARNAQLTDEKAKYVVLAPVSGAIFRYDDLRPGNFINPGQVIAYISSDHDLVVESYVSTSDIGLIHEEMSVKFQIHAFNSNQWGLASGRVLAISNDVVLLQGKPQFMVTCSVDQQFLSLKNGYTGHLKKGMSLTARFAIAKRTLFQLLYDKVDDWLDPNAAKKF